MTKCAAHQHPTGAGPDRAVAHVAPEICHLLFVMCHHHSATAEWCGVSSVDGKTCSQGLELTHRSCAILLRATLQVVKNQE